MTDRHRSVEDLEADGWGDAPPDETYAVRMSHAVRQKPLSALTPEEIALAVRQQIGLEWVVPLALDIVAEDPTLESHYYPGDLLNSLMGLPPDFWPCRAAWRQRVENAFVEFERRRTAQVFAPEDYDREGELSELENRDHFAGTRSRPYSRWLRGNERRYACDTSVEPSHSEVEAGGR